MMLEQLLDQVLDHLHMLLRLNCRYRITQRMLFFEKNYRFVLDNFNEP